MPPLTKLVPNFFIPLAKPKGLTKIIWFILLSASIPALGIEANEFW